MKNVCYMVIGRKRFAPRMLAGEKSSVPQFEKSCQSFYVFKANTDEYSAVSNFPSFDNSTHL